LVPPPPKAAPAQPAAAEPLDEKESVRVPIEEPFFIPLDGKGKRNGRAGEPRVFLHLSLSISLSNKAAVREVSGKRSQIREAIFEHFNRLSLQDILTPKGREQSKIDLIARLSKEVHQGKVQAVYFEEFFTR